MIGSIVDCERRRTTRFPWSENAMPADDGSRDPFEAGEVEELADDYAESRGLRRDRVRLVREAAEAARFLDWFAGAVEAALPALGGLPGVLAEDTRSVCSDVRAHRSEARRIRRFCRMLGQHADAPAYDVRQNPRTRYQRNFERG